MSVPTEITAAISLAWIGGYMFARITRIWQGIAILMGTALICAFLVVQAS